MTTTKTPSPVPKNLRASLDKAMDLMTDEQLLDLHNAVLDKEIQRLRQLISDDAEKERAAGKLDDLPEVIAAYRAQKRRS